VDANGQLQLDTKTATAQSGQTTEPALRAVERVYVEVNANGQIRLRQDVAQVDEIPTGIMLVEVTQQRDAIHIEIADFKRNQVSQYRATLLDGQALPDWIQIDPATGQVTATPPIDVQLIELKFIAQDASGGIRTLEIRIDLSGQSVRSETSSLSPAEASPRTTFMTQIALHHQQWDGYGDQILSVFAE
jgi:hypothetical protein